MAAGPAFAARQAYETLIRLDCLGRTRPALAESWRRDDDGRTWTLTIRAGAHFWDGVPVTADSVAARWWADSAGAAAAHLAGIASATAASDRELRLTLTTPRDSLPAALAAPLFAVMRASGSPTPIGTGLYRPVGSSRPPNLLASASGLALPVVVLLPAPEDLRDLLDRGADLVVTDDPATLAYAATRPDLASLPLPWGRTYVLVAPGGPPVGLEPVSTPNGRTALARDAVRVEARAAELRNDEPCLSDFPDAAPPPSARAAPRIAYPAGDRIAHDLAARLVALGIAGARTALPLPADAMLESLRAGREAGYVIALDRARLLSCDGVGPPHGSTVLPLVDTRARAVVRRATASLAIDWDGTIRLLAEPVGSSP